MSTASHAVGRHDPNQRWYLRIPLFHRISHFFLMLSFVGLAASGLAISFAERRWALRLSDFMGGVPNVLLVHKISAIVLTAVFAVHLIYVFVKGVIFRDWGMFWGPKSMVPNLKDGRDIIDQFKWFFGLGPRAKFDQMTYMEKFDYWAVFWGMFIIGTSGYMLWFSGWFSRFIPGWWFNISFIVHSEEALLAIWFIFLIHFFNNHLRAEKFPMDLVIFTGRVSEHEMHEERPGQVERMAREGKPPAPETSPPSAGLRILGYIIGATIIITGLALTVATLIAKFG